MKIMVHGLIVLALCSSCARISDHKTDWLTRDWAACPLDHAVKQNLTINVYYTGLNRMASVSENGGKSKNYPITRGYEITIPVTVEPNSQSWYIIK